MQLHVKIHDNITVTFPVTRKPDNNGYFISRDFDLAGLIRPGLPASLIGDRSEHNLLIQSVKKNGKGVLIK